VRRSSYRRAARRSGDHRGPFRRAGRRQPEPHRTRRAPTASSTRDHGPAASSRIMYTRMKHRRNRVHPTSRNQLASRQVVVVLVVVDGTRRETPSIDSHQSVTRALAQERDRSGNTILVVLDGVNEGMMHFARRSPRRQQASRRFEALGRRLRWNEVRYDVCRSIFEEGVDCCVVSAPPAKPQLLTESLLQRLYQSHLPSEESCRPTDPGLSSPGRSCLHCDRPTDRPPWR
jgi:hypothetical protein